MRMIKITALVLGIFSLWGCSQNRLLANYRELDQTELIQTLGMDRAGSTVSVTVATGVNPDGSYTIFTGEAATVSKALSEIHTFPTKKFLFFGHTNNLIIGSDMLNDMTDCLDFIERNSDMRLDSPFFVVRNGSAKDLIREAQIGNARVTELLAPLTDESNLGSDNHVFTTKEIISVLTAEGYALVYAIQLTKDEDKISQGNANIIPAGYGIVKNGGVIGYVEYEDCLGVNLLINEAVNGILEVDDSNGGFVSLSLANSSCKIEGNFTQQGIESITAKIKTSANIEQTDNELDVGDPAVIEKLEGLLAEKLKGYCQRVVEQSKTLNTDFLGLEKRVSVAHPLLYEKHYGNGEDFPLDVPVNIEVEALIERTYDIVKTGGVN